MQKSVRYFTVTIGVLFFLMLSVMPAKTQEELLFLAIQDSDIQKVKLLLENGSDPNEHHKQQPHAGVEEVAPLCTAVKDNKLEISKLLLEYDANPNISCSNEPTPLHIALSHGQLDMIKLLLKYDADPSVA